MAAPSSIKVEIPESLLKKLVKRFAREVVFALLLGGYALYNQSTQNDHSKKVDDQVQALQNQLADCQAANDRLHHDLREVRRILGLPPDPVRPGGE